LELGLHPYCNYLKQIIPDWGPKITILDIIKKIPSFLLQLHEKGECERG
jgi:hypothetical protein